MSNENTAKNADFYKETVFLPKTDFPMRAGLAQKEPEILKKWDDEDIYGTMRAQSKGKEKFILHDGPPYANGHLHMGHAMNKVLKDVVVRSWQMMGYDAPYVPGWDCHGLPIEWKVEEKYREAGQDKDDIEPIAFRDECRKFAKKWVDIQSTEFERLGINGDWENPYLTMNVKSEARIVDEIHKFLLNGNLYKGAKPVMWSVVEKTALAEAEVEYKEHKSITIWVRFPVVSTKYDILNGADVVIWTTTPWTIPSNRAVCFHDDIEYGLYEVQAVKDDSRAAVGDRIVLAANLADAVKAQAGIEQWDAVDHFKGEVLEGTVLAHPLVGKGYEFPVPLLSGDHVTADAGTGFVHTAPSHGADDFEVGLKHGLEITDNVTDDGLFRAHVPLFAGGVIYDQQGKMGDGNFAVIKALNECGRLLSKGSVRHEYPHSWRSKAPVIFRTTPQWFIAMDGEGKIREKALGAIKQTRWLPAAGQNRITAMIEQRPDWCISRQRAWGVPIAIFIAKADGVPLRDPEVCKRIYDAFAERGADAWYTDDAQSFLGDGYKAEDYDQVFDIVDVWFESGSTHAFVLEDREELSSPADLYLEGSDQHRGWFHSSLLESVGSRGCAPYKTVLTHGFVLDDKGYKMSKSLGNIVAPEDIIKQYGADILRLWALTSDYGEDIRIGKDAIKSTTDIYRRIRNTFRFLLGALEGFSEEERVDLSKPSELPELEQLVLHQLQQMDQEIRSDIKNYNFGKLAHKLHNFCSSELSALYFDIRKDRLYCDRPDMFERRACRSVLAEVFECLTSWLAPMLCFTCEDVWTHRPEGLFPDAGSIHLREFRALPQIWQNDDLATKWDDIRTVRRVVSGALEPKRADKTIGSSLEAHPQIIVSSTLARTLKDTDLAEVCITSQATLTVSDDLPADAFTLNDAPHIGVVFAKAEGEKCQRCWKILPDVGRDSDYPELSARDADAVKWYEAHKQKAA
jgi:isoleucyl-tRNA synthetase|tara:strand:- start:106510 stop:109407 length:2898 start_codon:yes stop_codon:yes gene_type:complete